MPLVSPVMQNCPGCGHYAGGAGGFLFKSAARAEDVDHDPQDQRDAQEQPDVAE